MPVGDNLLDKAAMQDLHRLSTEFPILVERVNSLAGLPETVAGIRTDVAVMATTVEALAQRIEEEPLRCPMREPIAELTVSLPVIREICERLDDDQKALEKDQKELREANAERKQEIAEINSRLKWWGGGLAFLAALITGLGEALRAIFMKGNP